ncbi:MAG: TIGR04282 family arsenosugar biosynthesis glycosyltransferase [Chromatiales bacterium]|jgi:rSAM/selenodomain-associated transferase 1
MQYPDARILIFARAPVAGQVKTRLAADIGAERAAQLYRELLQHTLEVAVAARLCPVVCYCDPDCQHEFFQEWRERGVLLADQQGDDLGERMQHALQQQLQEAGHAVLVGSDCPVLQQRHLQLAFDGLQDRQAVIAGAEDGGYALIGLKSAPREIFSGIEWSGSGVLQQTLQRFRQLSWQWRELETLWDVDRLEDLQRLAGFADYAYAIASDRD